MMEPVQSLTVTADKRQNRAASADLSQELQEHEISRNNRQMMLPFEFTLANDADAIDDAFAICRWEDDGGPVGRENADAE